MGFWLTPELNKALREDGVIQAEACSTRINSRCSAGAWTGASPIRVRCSCNPGRGRRTSITSTTTTPRAARARCTAAAPWMQREKAGANVEDAMKEGDLFRRPGFLQLR